MEVIPPTYPNKSPQILRALAWFGLLSSLANLGIISIEILGGIAIGGLKYSVPELLVWLGIPLIGGIGCMVVFPRITRWISSMAVRWVVGIALIAAANLFFTVNAYYVLSR